MKKLLKFIKYILNLIKKDQWQQARMSKLCRLTDFRLLDREWWDTNSCEIMHDYYSCFQLKVEKLVKHFFEKYMN